MLGHMAYFPSCQKCYSMDNIIMINITSFPFTDNDRSIINSSNTSYLGSIQHSNNIS